MNTHENIGETGKCGFAGVFYMHWIISGITDLIYCITEFVVMVISHKTLGNKDYEI